MQEQLGLEPCPMCILQRYAFIASAWRRSLAPSTGAPSASTAASCCSFRLPAPGVAIRHSYVQHFPPKGQSCGTDLMFMLDAFPLTQALPKIFAGTGDCSAVTWTFLGLSIPEWALVWFVLFAALALWVCLRKTAARF
jgi:Disulfide bond formation protein DsbB